MLFILLLLITIKVFSGLLKSNSLFFLRRSSFINLPCFGDKFYGLISTSFYVFHLCRTMSLMRIYFQTWYSAWHCICDVCAEMQAVHCVCLSLSSTNSSNKMFQPWSLLCPWQWISLRENKWIFNSKDEDVRLRLNITWLCENLRQKIWYECHSQFFSSAEVSS